MDLHKLGSVVYVLKFDADARSDLHMHGRHLRRSQARRERITGLHGDATANGKRDRPERCASGLE
jgi:hypothetical protein